ncbi:hypothetical protein ACGFYV_15885 [Streptomyces sp. NPDC048297]|uniref:hypothetical protein n=1 Tax=Streptomyces sp. NPDC048297 TaxID=3365531 RepID=UPI0037227E63
MATAINLPTTSPSPTPTPTSDPDPDPELAALRWFAAVAERALVALLEPGLDLDDRRRPTSAQLPEPAVDVAATEQHRRSLAIGDVIGAVIVQHSACRDIGYAHLTLGEPAAAARHFEESLRILGGHGDWHGESQTRLGLVRALRRLGEAERAARECAEPLRRADARADRYMGGLARHQHGLLLCEQGRRTDACDA